jgi:hypothetical protein
MTERRHRPALDQAHISSPFGPQSESVPRKLGAPSEPTNDRLQQPFYQLPQAAIRADATEEYHLAAGSEHSRTFVERCLRVWHRGNYVVRHDDIERSIGERQMLSIHHLQLLELVRDRSATRRCALRSMASERSIPITRFWEE